MSSKTDINSSSNNINNKIKPSIAMEYDILTLFPEVIAAYLDSSMLKKAQKEGIISYKTFNIRDYAIDEYGHVDDTLYGGGRGMLMRAEPLFGALEAARQSTRQSTSMSCKANETAAYTAANNAEARSASTYKTLTIYLSPKGKVFDQNMAKNLAQYEQLILVCGHYEGIDQRFIDENIDLELSIGDFVISSGELAALVVIDVVSRMLPGFLASAEAMQDESHYNKILEARQYTRPDVWHGLSVPEVLTSGNHQLIAEYKYLDALNETLSKRPDLFAQLNLSEDDLIKLLEYRGKL